ncbi:MAG: SAM-dependent methyltransferase [Gammaproteobacteria bacterium]
MIKRLNKLFYGVSLSDFQCIFALTEKDCESNILDCYSGPASFNAELTALGGKVISIDPLYAEPVENIEKIASESLDKQLSDWHDNPENFSSTKFSSPESYIEDRKKHLMQFLLDLPIGLKQQRYQTKSFQDLNFPDFHFDLALCSNDLFTSSSTQSVDYYLNMIKKLCGFAKEVRIFPMINSVGEVSSLLGPVILALSQSDYGVEVKSVDYKIEKDANTMLRVWAQTCTVSS